jgi:hypothetical protein
MRTDDGFAGRPPGNEIIDFGSRAIVNSDGETVSGHIENEVFSHHGETN